MDLGLSEEQTMLRDVARELLAKIEERCKVSA